MKQALTEIYNKKKQQEKILLSSNNKLLSIIYKDLAKNKTIREIHKDIRQCYIRLPIKDEKIYKYCLKVAKKGKKQVERDVNGAILIGGTLLEKERKQLYTKYSFKYLENNHIYQETKHLMYNYTQNIENKSKEQVLKQALKSDKVFFLASKHEKDCAKDHLHFQGHLYYNREYRKVLPQDLWSSVEKYVNQHHLMTFQKVIGKPIWFITRPNCRHYFKQLSVEEVIGGMSVAQMLYKYDMVNEVGIRRNIQSINHPTNKEWYTEENIQSMIKKYEERLKFHQALFNERETEDLKKAIDKDKLLIAKWKNYYRTRGKVIKVQ